MKIQVIKCNSYPGDRCLAVCAVGDGETAKLGNQIHNVYPRIRNGLRWYESDRYSNTWRTLSEVKVHAATVTATR